MNKLQRSSLVLIILASLASGWIFSPFFSAPVHASPGLAEELPPGPDRYAMVKMKIVVHEWWMAEWDDNIPVCQIFVEHDGMPTESEILLTCGEKLYERWKQKSRPCITEDPQDCPGFYWMHVRDLPGTKDVPVVLPPPQVWVTVENCEADLYGWCSETPSLILLGEEPLPNETITSLQGYAGTDAFSCQGNRCEFQLTETQPEGVRLQFWAYSTYGDSSESFEAIVRVISTENDEDTLVPKWYVDVLSKQWLGKPNASCSQAWESFPPPEGVAPWLVTPQTPDGLESNIPYAYLAGNLISQGVVDVSECLDGGLLANGAASECGLKAARRAVDEWQDRFDGLIFDIAQDTEVPAQLLKNLFSRESQFWPGVFREGGDVGLGQLTENGADTALLWNPSFYQQFCPLVLDNEVCESAGYAELDESDQATLRGALVHRVDATCPNCPLGIDISKADFSVEIFARTLLANCEQAGKIVENVTGLPAGQSVSYDDLWRFTLVNYNGGPGCLADAVELAFAETGELNWGNLVAQLDKDTVCRGAIHYVDDISK
jgi:hypothetical protein